MSDLFPEPGDDDLIGLDDEDLPSDDDEDDERELDDDDFGE